MRVSFYIGSRLNSAGSYLADFKNAFGKELVTNESFGATTLADIKPNEDPLVSIYQAAKTVADKKLWEIAAQHPDIEITVSKYQSLGGLATSA